jgi:hypothetical protein
VKNLDEINRLIAATVAELVALKSRRAELQTQVAELQREKAAFLLLFVFSRC